MPLLNAGYWPTTYWAEDYWPVDYWPEYGLVVTISRRMIILPAKPKLEEISNVVNVILQALQFQSPIITNTMGDVAPPTKFLRDGMLAYANGSSWDPGSGKGYYRYDSATLSWIFMG